MAQKGIPYYRDLWREMIVNDKAKIDHFVEIDDAIEFGYVLPDALREMKWMRNIQSTLPVQVIVVGAKTLATIEPTVFIQPLNANAGTIKLANDREQNILWQFQQMEKRHKHGFINEIVESALKYDSIASFTVPTDWQIKGQKGSIPSRYKAALNQGGFITTVENPKDIHARFSPLGLDMVLNSKIMRARDAALFYGVEKLLTDVEGEDEEMFVAVYDYWDYDKRVLWISDASDSASLIEPGKNGYKVFNEKMKLPFLPWTIVEGGSNLATRTDHKIRPLLGPVVHSKQLELSNLIQSMAFSEVTGYAAAPRYLFTSHSGETFILNYGDINKIANLKPGETLERLEPPAIDGNLLLMYDRIEAAFNKLTGLRAIADLDSPSGTAFATVNAQIKVATTALDPPKKLSERALSGIAEIILRWTAHTGDDLVGYGTRDRNLGVEFRTPSNQVDPKEIYINVTLSHHIPTDELQQINAVTILMNEVGISFIDAATRLNISNPEELLARKRQEDLDSAMLAIAIKEMNAESDLKIQAQQMQLQMGMQQQLLAQQQAQQQPPQQGGGSNLESARQARLAQGGQRTPPSSAQSLAARGQRVNPNRGGLSPNEINPEGFTREGATGIDSEGETI